MPAREVRHGRHHPSGVWKADVVPELEKAQDRLLLLLGWELLEGAREVPTRSGYCRSASAVVPVHARVQAWAPPSEVKPDEQFLDQQAVIEEDRRRRGHGLLVLEFWVLDAGQALLVSLCEHAPEFSPGSTDASGHHQRGVAEVNEPNLSTVVDAPAVTEFRGQARLSAV